MSGFPSCVLLRQPHGSGTAWTEQSVIWSFPGTRMEEYRTEITKLSCFKAQRSAVSMEQGQMSLGDTGVYRLATTVL